MTLPEHLLVGTLTNEAPDYHDQFDAWIDGMELLDLADNPAYEQIKAIMGPQVKYWMDVHGDRFSEFPELQQKIEEPEQEAIIEAICETLTMLNTEPDQIPEPVILRYSPDIFGEGPSHPEMKIMGVQNDLRWLMEYEFLYKTACSMKTYRERGDRSGYRHASITLIHMIGHEAFHVFDVHNNPHRAEAAIAVNKRTRLTWLAYGENEPEQFGRHYGRLKAAQLANRLIA